LLLGPGKEIVDAILWPATDAYGPLTWLQDLLLAPEDAFVRAMAALGVVVAVRLLAALLLALIARLPGPMAASAARLGRFLAPPLARRFIDVIVGVSLTSGAGIALSAPALAATHPAATVVPAPVLAPPEAMLQTWPDLGRPGTDVPTSRAPQQTPSPRASHHSISHSPLPDSRSTDSAAPKLTNPATTSAAPTKIVVAPGDCLWSLAERDLENRNSTEPSLSDIAAATEKWWQTNRASIGANPDRLTPGQRLQPPA
jgi:hypothetical protein